MTTRRQARTRAVELLFAADVRGVDVQGLAEDAGSLDPFTRQLLDAVREHIAELDERIAAHAKGWSLGRMPAVDRTLLRLGVAEMLHVEDVPARVAIDEAVELAKSLSTDDSPRFVNGVLAAIAEEQDLL